MSILPFVGSALGVLGGVAGTLINNSNTDATNAANRAFQTQQQFQQEEYNEQQVDIAREYNSPEAVMARFKAANLNPNLIYGAATNNVAVAPIPAPHVDYVAQPHPVIQPENMVDSALNTYNNLRLGDAQASNLNADTALKAAQAGQAVAQAALSDATTDRIHALLPSEVGLNEANIAQLNAGAQKAITDTQIDAFLAPFTAANLSAHTADLDADARFKIDDDTRQQLMNSQSIKESIARIGAIYIGNAKSLAEIGQIQQTVKNMQNDAIIQQADIDMRNQGMMPHDSAIGRGIGVIFNKLFGSGGTGMSIPTYSQPSGSSYSGSNFIGGGN